MYLGQLAYGKRLWEPRLRAILKPASPSSRPYRRVWRWQSVRRETEQLQKAEAQRKLVLESVSDEEEPLAFGKQIIGHQMNKGRLQIRRASGTAGGLV